MTISKQLQRAILNARNARLERYVRAGAGFFSPQKALTTIGWGQTSPLTAAERLRPALYVTSFEFIGPGYPVIPNIIHTGSMRLSFGGLNNSIVLSDVTGFEAPLITMTQVANYFAIGSVHYIAVYADPVADRCGLWFDGVQVGQAAFTPTTLDFGFIAYIGTDPFNDPFGIPHQNVGTIGPLEIFPGFVPPTFVF